jgi:alpha-galactosidase
VLTGHVSDVPNQQTNRTTPIEFRGAVSLSTIFGYELNPLHATEADRAEMRKQIAFYKSIRHIVEHGDFYRLKSPFNGDDAAWMFVTPDKSEAYVTYYLLRQECHLAIQHRLKMQGLDPRAKYHVENGYNAHNKGAVTGVFSGDFLTNVGYRLPMFTGDYQAYSCVLRRLVDMPYLGRDASVPLTTRQDIIENFGA